MRTLGILPKEKNVKCSFQDFRRTTISVPCPVDNTFIVILVHSFNVVRLRVRVPVWWWWPKKVAGMHKNPNIAFVDNGNSFNRIVGYCWVPTFSRMERMLSHILFVGGSMKPCWKETMGTISQEISQNRTVQHVNQTVRVIKWTWPCSFTRLDNTETFTD